jgi:hypothetical protein
VQAPKRMMLPAVPMLPIPSFFCLLAVTGDANVLSAELAPGLGETLASGVWVLWQVALVWCRSCGGAAGKPCTLPQFSLSPRIKQQPCSGPERPLAAALPNPHPPYPPHPTHSTSLQAPAALPGAWRPTRRPLW